MGNRLRSTECTYVRDASSGSVDHVQYQHFRHQVPLPWTILTIDYLQFTPYYME
jgi:hypothetical protein